MSDFVIFAVVPILVGLLALLFVERWSSARQKKRLAGGESPNDDRNNINRDTATNQAIISQQANQIRNSRGGL